ncbi:metal-dependent hydrolase family protein [Amycolatopsis jejuensis]|uniref:metal-dependent hydrolase family protein n=1 Tax=Amycolatopsis jejuensis TaxID=330084 RepID=UPI000527D51D|nr:amidohydrolase family protein [Amycolatopsis jejuensis]
MSERLVLAGGSVFDGVTPERADVLVVDGRIEAIGSGIDGDVVLDVTGQTVLPGFIDCHVHVMFSEIDSWRILQTPFSLLFFQAARNLRVTLESGITTVRDAAGADYGIRRAVETGLIPGPRMRNAITMLSQTGGHGDDHLPSGCDAPLLPVHPGAPGALVDGVAEARVKVRELVRARADWIKVATTGGVLSADELGNRQFRDDELAEITAEAAMAGLDVMAHAHAAEGIKAAVRHGVRSIEHGVYLDDEAIELMLRHGTWLVPTLSAPLAVVERAAAGASALPRGAVEKAKAVLETHTESFRRAVDAGVRIAMGTDSGVGVHGTNLAELELMAKAGMAPFDVLRASTRGGAELLRLDEEIGRVQPGFAADLVVLDGDPADLSAVASRVTTVVQAGRVVRSGEEGK